MELTNTSAMAGVDAMFLVSQRMVQFCYQLHHQKLRVTPFTSMKMRSKPHLRSPLRNACCALLTVKMMSKHIKPQGKREKNKGDQTAGTGGGEEETLLGKQL